MNRYVIVVMFWFVLFIISYHTSVDKKNFAAC